MLINNAGLALGIETAPDAILNNWEEMVQTNILGLIRISHIVLKKMTEQQKGYIISVGSTAGRYPYAGGNVYGATKAFVEQFMINLKTDMLGTPLRFTTLALGLCGGSEFSSVRLGSAEKARAVYEGTTPLQPVDIANTILWLLQQPEHVNINFIEMMPVCQAPAGLAIDRELS